MSIILIFIFCFKTINTIKIDFFKNFPTKQKLKEIYRSNLKHNQNNNNTISNDILKVNHPPKNKNTINLYLNGKKSDFDSLIKINKVHLNQNNNNKIVNNNVSVYDANKIKNRETNKIKTSRTKNQLIIRNIFNKDINNGQNKIQENTSNIKIKSPTFINKLNNSNARPLKITSLPNKQNTSNLNN